MEEKIFTVPLLPEFKGITGDTEAQLTTVLNEFMREIRRLKALADPEFKTGISSLSAGQMQQVRLRPERCHTCAFVPETDILVGFFETAYNLVRAFADDEPFHCHDGQDWKNRRINPETMLYCAGFVAVVMFQKEAAKIAARKALAEMRAILPGIPDAQQLIVPAEDPPV